MTNSETTVLIVDDEDRIRRLLKLYLTKENYETEEVENGLTALEMIKANDYDVVLLDIMLPGMD